MKNVKLTCANGHNWETSVNPNSTNESILEYFMNKQFNTHPNKNEDAEDFSPVVRVEIDGVKFTSHSKKEFTFAFFHGENILCQVMANNLQEAKSEVLNSYVFYTPSNMAPFEFLKLFESERVTHKAYPRNNF